MDLNGNTYEIITDGSNEQKGTVSYTSAKKNVKSVTVPSTVTINELVYEVTVIAENAFAGNKKSTKAIIGKNAFKGVHKKVFFKVPAGKKKAYKKLWKAKTGYKKSMKIK